jgi:hypothetical protein
MMRLDYQVILFLIGGPEAGQHTCSDFNTCYTIEGRGIVIADYGYICIEYWEDGCDSTGNYIHIHSDGEFDVGEIYTKDGMKRRKGTYYKNGGT